MSAQALIATPRLDSPIRLVKLVIAGSRGLSPSPDRIHDAVDEMLADLDIVPIEVVSGNARGVDRAGEQWAVSVGLVITRFPISQADWKTYGRFAGPRRNCEMAKYGEALLAFWDGHSRGTKDIISQMRDRGKPVRVVGGR
jgi:hypothetical protein